jgi:hypothetical protein
MKTRDINDYIAIIDGSFVKMSEQKDHSTIICRHKVEMGKQIPIRLLEVHTFKKVKDGVILTPCDGYSQAEYAKIFLCIKGEENNYKNLITVFIREGYPIFLSFSKYEEKKFAINYLKRNDILPLQKSFLKCVLAENVPA